MSSLASSTHANEEICVCPFQYLKEEALFPKLPLTGSILHYTKILMTVLQQAQVSPAHPLHPDLGRKLSLHHQKMGSYRAGRRVWLRAPPSIRNKSGGTHHFAFLLSDS